jgi:hypothetical protein
MHRFFATLFAVSVHPAEPMRSLSLRARTSHRRTTATARHSQLGVGLLAVGIGVGIIIQAGSGLPPGTCSTSRSCNAPARHSGPWRWRSA